MSPSPPRRPIATLPSPGCGFARGACSWAAGAQIRSGAGLSAGGAGPLPFPKANRSGWVLTRPSVESCGQLARQHQPADQRTQKRLSLAQSLRINTLFPPVIDCLVLCMWKAAALRTSCKGRGTMCPEGPSPSDRGVYHISASYWQTFLSEAERPLARRCRRRVGDLTPPVRLRFRPRGHIMAGPALGVAPAYPPRPMDDLARLA